MRKLILFLLLLGCIGCTPSEAGFLLTSQSAGGDTTPPTLTSATVATSGASVSLVFSENVSVGAGGNGGWTFTSDHPDGVLTYSSGSGTGTLVYTLAPIIDAGSITVNYTQPGNGIEDSAGNDLANVSGGTVTNSSYFVLNESFEGTGYADNPSSNWAETKSGSSTVDEDFSSTGLSMEGSSVLKLYFDWAGDTCSSLRTLASSNADLWGKFMYRYENTSTRGYDIFAIYDSSNNKLAAIWMDSGGLRCTHGSVDDANEIAVAVDTTQYIWWWYSNGSGSNGDFEVYVSTNTTKPETTVLDISNGTSTGTANKLQMNWVQPENGNIAYFDHVQSLTNGGTDWSTW